MPPQVELQVWSLQSHLLQIYAGFSLLAQQGAIRLTQRIVAPPRPRTHAPQHLRQAAAAHVATLIDGVHRVHFDLHDSSEIDADAADASALYFKRSFRAADVPAALRDKVRPLGLNYAVTTDRPTWLELRRNLALSRGGRARLQAALSHAARCVGLEVTSQRRATLSSLEEPPRRDQEPRVLFMARAWDPADIQQHDAAKIEERRIINSVRADCVVRLRREFGPRFLGGLEHTPFAERSFPDALVPADLSTTRRAYLERLRGFPICIATMGLHGSNGWKLGEYVALSKSIVTERLCHEVPGPFAEGSHYLGFDDPSQCVEAVGRLMDQRSVRLEMMERNWQYYRQFVRPDQMVLRALNQLKQD